MLMTEFSEAELKLICRALNNWAPGGEIKDGEEIRNSLALATRIYRENFRIGTPNETPEITLTELFGWYDGTKADPEHLTTCANCGCTVARDSTETHRQWHNRTAKK